MAFLFAKIVILLTVFCYFSKANQCIESATVECASHDSELNDLCDELEQLSVPSHLVTCVAPYNKCAVLYLTFSYTFAPLEVDIVETGCAYGNNGCYDRNELLQQDPDFQDLIEEIERDGLLEVENVSGCICSDTLCSSGVTPLAGLAVILPATVMVIVKDLLLG
ncbi:hypothetical protein BSL78_24955 [Apostichopus japonicus]|uniref:Uncharacterized protein n=1 Tax=Stichopus japonicus TaxID=307972 RepID=A0A2G8JR04_STIJA|nr:hypothetical protein BSL78_24955 [Apostichopus japonicus]